MTVTRTVIIMKARMDIRSDPRSLLRKGLADSAGLPFMRQSRSLYFLGAFASEGALLLRHTAITVDFLVQSG